MNIRTIPPYLTNTVQNSGTPGKTGTQDNATVVNGASSDQVQLSQDYQDLAQAQKSIAGADQVRTEKVQQIKSQLESGNYQIKPGAIAGSMLDEII
jgi:flagellar biosynthesis anti-sigma factor FlgM